MFIVMIVTAYYSWSLHGFILYFEKVSSDDEDIKLRVLSRGLIVISIVNAVD